jgi:hypothetical protein
MFKKIMMAVPVRAKLAVEKFECQPLARDTQSQLSDI